jgi:hypothetical protein
MGRRASLNFLHHKKDIKISVLKEEEKIEKKKIVSLISLYNFININKKYNNNK